MADEAETTSPEAPAPAETGTRPPGSPGQQLQQARQARKLDVSYVATALRLSPQVVEAIERDDYSRLPSAVFVSGYIRSYARLMGLDPEPLNQRFHELHPNAEAPPRHVARSESALSEPTEGGPLLGYLLTILLVLAVAAGAYGWWVTRPAPDPMTNTGTSPDLTDGAGTEAEREPSGSTASDPIASPAQGPSDMAPSVDQPADTDSTPGPSPEPVLRASSDVVIVEREGAQPQAQGADPTSDSIAELGPSDQPEPLPTPNSPELEPPTAPAPTATEDDDDLAVVEPSLSAVELAFSGPCWVDIRDSTGTVLLFGEMSQGDRETLEGTPPYSLVIGNAAAVELRVGGEPFDLKSVARGNVARFELDPAEISAQSPNTTE